jgi:hypothetical protein
VNAEYCRAYAQPTAAAAGVSQEPETSPLDGPYRLVIDNLGVDAPIATSLVYTKLSPTECPSTVSSPHII